jgi:DNA-binding transcriptional LysR family regulator
LNNQFDWTLVRSFLAALEQGSLLGASRVVRVSQPTIGRHIAELESQLGVVLFERTGRGLRPTPVALGLADAARLMETGAQQVARTVTGADGGIRGSVRITASQPVACYLLPPLLAQMRLLLPDVQVELVASNAVSNLLRREADIAVRMVRPAQATLTARRVGKIGIRACAHQDYLRRRGIPRQPADLLGHDLIGGDQDDTILKGLSALGLPVQRENFCFRSDDLIATWAAVRAGIGIGFVSEYQIRSDSSVVALLPMLKIPPLPVWLAVHREIRTSGRIRAVYDFLAQALGNELP